MFCCPHCHHHLERLASDQGVQWRCAGCEGRAVTIPMLRRLMQHGYVNQLWRAARDTPESNGLACPLCHNAMRVVQNLPDESGDSLHVDVCTSCHSVWFDTHQMDTLLEHVARPPEPAKSELSPKAREILALARIEQIREQADRECPEGALPPADGWQAILTVFGFPVEKIESLRDYIGLTGLSRFAGFALLGFAKWGDPPDVAGGAIELRSSPCRSFFESLRDYIGLTGFEPATS